MRFVSFLEGIFIRSSNMLRRGYSIAAERMFMYLCVFHPFGQNSKKPIARMIIKLCTLFWHGLKTNPINFEVNLSKKI